MIRFKEQDGKLFRMLDKPVPLTTDAKLPCIIAPIQDDSPMGKYVKQCWGHDKIFMREYTICGIKEDIAAEVGVAKGTPISIHMFEIIGTFVEEGSSEWALYQMMQGNIVCQKYSRIKRHYEDGCVLWMDTTNLERRLPADVFLEDFDGTMNWQIYVKPEPKPLLADAQVGDLCKHRNGDWSQIIDTNGTYIPGQPIRTTLKDTKGINRNFCLSGSHFIALLGGEYDIIHTEPLAPEGTAEWAWQMAKLGIETRCYEGKIRVAKSGLIEVCYNGMAYAMPLTQSAENRQYVINKIRECSPDGWQIHKEPKEEPLYKVGDCRIEFVKQELRNLLDKI